MYSHLLERAGCVARRACSRINTMKISSLLTYRFTTSLVAAALLLVASTISGCGGGGSGGATTVDVPPTGGSTPNSVAISGQALKGPMHDSTLEVVDPDGDVLATGQTQNGNFGLTVDIADLPYVEIRTRGGYFMDEATGGRVDVDPAEGLCAIVSASDMQTRGHEIVLTPETTIIAHTMQHSMAAGSSLQDAMTNAVDTYHNQFVGGSRPPGMGADADRPMHFGSPLDPVSAEDALAWHRARSFSRYANETGLAPESMFELMEALGLDMH